MLVNEYIRLDAQQLAQLIKKGETSAEEALNCAIKRMEEVNPLLNAIITDCSDWGYQQLIRMNGDEPYYGVPLLVKDLGFALQGVRNTGGSRFFQNNKGLATSDFIQRLLDLGFIPFAKTNTPELGLSYVTEPILFGPCRNPYDLNRSPGGSSGGSAAAVAAGVAPVATASDGGGSIRIPAACCGLFGFKPTHGLMPAGPWVEEQWSGMATNFILSRSIRDAADLFPLLAETIKLQPSQTILPKQLKFVQLEKAYLPVPIAEPCLAAVDKISAILRTQGHQVEKRTLALDLEKIGECSLILIAANTHAEIIQQEQALGRKATENDLEHITWTFHQQGKKISAAELITAKNMMQQHLRPLHELLKQVDFILSPALAQLPLKIATLRMDDDFESYLQKNIEFSPFTALFNQAGVPAMSLPVYYHNKLPVSVQFAAAKGMDQHLLQLALKLQPLLSDFSQPIKLK